jgi:predicted membrane-bound spermidine synthase
LVLLLISLAIVALVLLLLALPLGIWLSASFHGNAVFAARIECFFGLFSWKLSTGRSTRHKQVKPAAEGESHYYIFRVIEAVQVKGLGGRIALLVKRLCGRARVNSIQSDLSVSLGDDYDTGMLAGLLIPLVMYLNRRFNGAITLRPAFEEDMFLEGDISGDLRVRPMQVLVSCLAFALSPQFRQARRILAGDRCKRK